MFPIPRVSGKRGTERHEVLIRRTFIDFKSSEPTGLTRCWSWPSALDREQEAVHKLDFIHPGQECSPALSTTVSKDAESESDASTSNATPGVSYRFTPTSARAASLWHVLPDAAEVEEPLPVEIEAVDHSGSAEEEDLNECPTISDGADLPSVGSANHGIGGCRKCCFFPKGRCTNGAACGYCHFAHDQKRTSKTKKKKLKAFAMLLALQQTAALEFGVIFQVPQMLSITSVPSAVEVVLNALSSEPSEHSEDGNKAEKPRTEPVQILLETALPDKDTARAAPEDGYGYAYVPVAVWGYGTTY